MPVDPASLSPDQRVKVQLDAENDLRGKVLFVDETRFGFENSYTRLIFKHGEPLAVYVRDSNKSRKRTYILGGVILVLLIGLGIPVIPN